MTVDMIKELDLDTYTFYMLTVYPGTPYFEKYKKEGRVLTNDYGKFDWDHVVIKPKNMTERELEEGVRWAYRELDRYYRPRFIKRSLKYGHFLFKSLELAKFLLTSGYPRRYKIDY